MASTPSNRLRVTPSSSPSFFAIPSRTPIRSRSHDPRLSLQRVVGATCCGNAAFDTVRNSFAYTAGAAVVVVGVEGPDQYSQRFYRARPTAVPIYPITPITHTAYSSNTTPKANDSRNRVATYGSPDWSDSPTSKTWTSRERIKAATCVSLSRDGRFLAVGETGYAPRVLIFGLQDNSSDKPLVSISEHGFGVKAVAWSPDGKFLASLGFGNDGFLFVWRVDQRTGSTKLFQQNRCTTGQGLLWMSNNVLITYGTRHVKSWKVEETPHASSPGRRNFGDITSQKALPGRNILLGSLLEASFACSLAIDSNHALICSEGGDVCVLDDTSGQMKLTRLVGLDFSISCVSMRAMTAYIGGKSGQLAILDIQATLQYQQDDVVKQLNASSTGFIALGFIQEGLVTIDSRHSIDIWGAQDLSSGSTKETSHTQLPGLGASVSGIDSLPKFNEEAAAFYTWSGAGLVQLWGLDGTVKSSLDIPLEQHVSSNNETEPNQLCVVRADNRARVFVTGDKYGVLRIIDYATKEHLLETKAHSSEITHITIYQDGPKFLIATCARDRTVQLFHRNFRGDFELFQTLEFTARVIQVFITPDEKVITCSMDRTLTIYNLAVKEDELDAMAAIYSRSIALKAAPTSMVLGPASKSVFVSHLDRSIYQFEIASGRQASTFRCLDENGEAGVMDSLIFGRSMGGEPSFLLGISNTDKSVRLYDSHTGNFLDREWGHTEAITGVILLDDEEKASRTIISAGCDGTIMVWALELQYSSFGLALSRSPSPMKDSSTAANLPPLRRVLSKAELAEFGQRSPPRSVRKRPSRHNLSTSITRTTTSSMSQTSLASTLVEETPPRKGSSSRSGSPPPVSPRTLNRRPSLPVLGNSLTQNFTARKKSSAMNLRASYGNGSPTLNLATEQTCRQLRQFRAKLSSSESIKSDTISELDAELRLTTAALDERVNRRQQAMSESVLNGLLDQYSDRLVSMLDAKLRLRLERERDESPSASPIEERHDRPRTARTASDGSIATSR